MNKWQRRIDRLRWKLLRRLVKPIPPVELLGYAAARAGYTDMPQLTPERFVIHHMSADPVEPMFGRYAIKP